MIYKFEADKKGARLEILGEIGGAYGFTLNHLMKATESLTDGVLTITINSKGGDVIEAFGIHDYLKSLKIRSEVEIYGEASSAATIIAAGADIRGISGSSKYLVHFCSTMVAGTKKETGAAYENQVKIDNQMLAIYVKQTGKTEAELTALMEKDNYLSAQEALEWGFVDKILTNDKNEKAMTKTKFAAQAEETDEPKIEELLELIEELKEELAAANAKLKAYEEEEEEKEKEEIEALKTEAKKVGLITAENEQIWAKADKTVIAEAIKSYQTYKLPPVPKIEPTVTTTAEGMANLLTEFKAGKITAKVYAEKLQQFKN